MIVYCSVIFWVCVSIKRAVGKIVHAILHFHLWREEGWCRASINVAIEVFEDEVGKLEYSKDVAWNRQLELLEDNVGESNDHLIYCVKL